jgi:lysophospholipase L1-like esterase
MLCFLPRIIKFTHFFTYFMTLSMNKLLFLFLLTLSGFSSLNQTPNQVKQNGGASIETMHIGMSDTLFAKDLKKLSKFADTAKLNRFIEEIRTFQVVDSIKTNLQPDIIFTGSSSVRKWKTLEKDLSSCNLLNRAFGGSTIPEVIYYSDVLIFKHKPSKIVLYAGENDVSNSRTSVKMVVESFKYFQQMVKYHLPNSSIYFVSIKPSPSRLRWWPKMKMANQQIKQYCDTTKNCHFIDVSSRMLNSEGKIKKDIFLWDMLHLNEKGYKIWAEEIGKALECKVNKGL